MQLQQPPVLAAEQYLKSKLVGQWYVLDPPLGKGGGGTASLAFRKDIVGELASVAGGLAHVNSSVPPGLRLARSLLQIAAQGGVGVLKESHRIGPNVPKEELDREQERVRREITTMVGISSRHVVEILDHDQHMQWFVMEYYSGGNLENHKSEYQGQVLKALTAIRPIIEAVALELHPKKIVHRDIKPKNIFVAADGRLVLGDFGIVFTQDDDRTRMTKPGDTVGSRDWLPDWVRHKNSADFTLIVDVFMLAKVIYFMVSSKDNVIASQLKKPEFDLRQLFPATEGIPELAGFLEGTIVTDEDRCACKNAGEMLKAIDKLVARIAHRPSCLLVADYIQHSTGAISVESAQSLQKVGHPYHVFIPPQCKRLFGKMRAVSWSGVEVCFKVGETKAAPVGVASGNDKWPGIWSPEIEMEFKDGLSGWCDVSIMAVQENVHDTRPTITGFVLWAQ